MDAIRWVLVAVNFIGAGLLGYTGYHFFFPKERVAVFREHDARLYVRQAGAGGIPKIGSYDAIMDNLREKPPEVREQDEFVRPQGPAEEEALDGGPLAEKWDLAMTVPDPDDPSVRRAYLSQRATPRFSVPPRGRPAAFTPAAPAPRPGGPGVANFFVVPGESYRMQDGGKTFVVVRVEMHSLVYRWDGKLHRLAIEAPEDPRILESQEDNVVIKEAPAPMELELPPSDRGDIIFGDAEVRR